MSEPPVKPTSASATQPSQLTPEAVWQHLHNVIDPELGIDIVRLGLVYNVELLEAPVEKTVGTAQLPTASGQLRTPRLKITMTLTTPGCPLAGVFDQMVRDALYGLPDLDVDHEVAIQLTFDPPWVPDMMDEEAKAELGF